MLNIKKIFRYAVPNFLKRFDNYLLINYPIIWRTRVHYFFFFSFILGNLIFWFWGQNIAIKIDELPDLNAINQWVVYCQGLGLVILLAWGVDQYQNHLNESLRRYLPLTFVLYLFCIFSLTFSTTIVYQSLIPRIGALIPDEGFEASYKLHSENEFWEYSEEPVFQAAFEKNKEQIISDLLQYRSISEAAIPSLKFGGEILMTGITYEGFNKQRMHVGEELFGSRIERVKLAKDFRNGTGQYYEEYGNWTFLLLGISAFLSLLLAVMVHFRSFFLREAVALRQFFQAKSELQKRNASRSKLEGWLITHQPYIWSTKLHKLLKVLINTALMIVLVDVVYYLLTEELVFTALLFEENDPNEKQFLDLRGIGFAVSTILLSMIFGMLWSFQQRRRKELPPSFRDNVVLIAIYYVIVCVFYSAIASLSFFLNFMDYEDKMLLYIVMPFVGIMVGGGIYLTKFIERRRAMIGIPMLGGAIAYVIVMIYIETIRERLDEVAEAEFDGIYFMLYIFLVLFGSYQLCSLYYRKNNSYPTLVMAAVFFICTTWAAGSVVAKMMSWIFEEMEGLMAVLFFNLTFPIICIFLLLPMIKLLLKKKMAPLVE